MAVEIDPFLLDLQKSETKGMRALRIVSFRSCGGLERRTGQRSDDLQLSINRRGGAGPERRAAALTGMAGWRWPI